MGIGMPLLEATAALFARRKSKALATTLREGRRHGEKPCAGGQQFILFPKEVVAAARTFELMADDVREELDDEFSEAFREELLEPFAKTAKKGMGIRGTWG